MLLLHHVGVFWLPDSAAYPKVLLRNQSAYHFLGIILRIGAEIGRRHQTASIGESLQIPAELYLQYTPRLA